LCLTERKTMLKCALQRNRLYFNINTRLHISRLA
jgi:hypothetical protein